MRGIDDADLGGDAATAERKRDRVIFIALMVVLVAITLMYVQRSAVEMEGVLLIAVFWVGLGYGAFFAACQAYIPGVRGGRPDLQVLHGIPAWSFFLGGGALVVGTSVAFAVWEGVRPGLTLTGFAIIYLTLAYPRHLSLRRGLIAGVGFVIGAVVPFFL